MVGLVYRITNRFGYYQQVTAAMAAVFIMVLEAAVSEEAYCPSWAAAAVEVSALPAMAAAVEALYIFSRSQPLL
jgi:hypothetical protein